MITQSLRSHSVPLVMTADSLGYSVRYLSADRVGQMVVRRVGGCPGICRDRQRLSVLWPRVSVCAVATGDDR